MSKSVLVTGGLGFVGSALCRALVEQKQDVIVLDNCSRGSLDNVEGLPVRFFDADVRDAKAVEDALGEARPRVVIHLAAMHFIPDCNADPAGCFHINVVGTENVLAACRKCKVERAVITSSLAVYPITDAPSREDDPAMPYDVYGESKLANEWQARRFQRETGIDTVVVRLSNVYGPRETSPHVIPEIMQQLAGGLTRLQLGNTAPRRDFIHSSDAARGFCSLALHPVPSGYHLVNLGGGREYSIRQVLEELSGLLGHTIEPVLDASRYRQVERMHLQADIRRIRELVGWEPAMTLTAGLRDLCQWYHLL
jgi:UDP-glucose 4-epimerase